MADELLNEMQIICTQGAIEESGEKIERLKAACHTKLSETESGTAVRISPRRVCYLVNLQFPVSQTKRSEDRIPTRLDKYACYVNFYEHISLHINPNPKSNLTKRLLMLVRI